MSAVTSHPSPEAPRWRTALPILAVLLLAVLVLYRETATVMVGIWQRSETFAHAWLVLPITLWLVWRQRAHLATLTPRPQPWVLLPMAAIALAWLMADLVVVNAATQYALVALLVLAVPLVLGLEVSHAILFPLLYLFFAVPFGDFLVPTLVEWTADFTVAALRATGVPVLREGQHFVIPSGRWSVVEECSGVRYLMASLTVGALFAYLNYRSYWRRAVFMGFAVLVPILANWLRAYMIVMLGHLSDNRIATGVDHLIYGWVFFGAIIFVMFLVGSRWSEPDHQGAGAGLGGSLVRISDRASSMTLGVRLLFAALAGAVVVALPHFAVASLERAEGIAVSPQLQLPQQLSSQWSASPTASPLPDAWAPDFANPTLRVSQTYTSPAGSVDVHIAYVRGQDEQRKLVTGQHRLVSTQAATRWLESGGTVRTVSADGHGVAFRTARLRVHEGLTTVTQSELQVWRSYWIDGRFVAGDIRAKLAGALARLQGRGDEGALLILSADAGSPQASNALLETFVRDNLAPLNALLQRTREQR